MAKKPKSLEPIPYRDAWHHDLYKVILGVLLAAIYKPLSKAITPPERADNAKQTPLERALKNGDVQYSNGAFRGNISASISKEIKELGGTFKRGAWRLPSPMLPVVLQRAIAANMAAMKDIEQRVDKVFLDMPERVAAMVDNMTVESMGVQGMNRVSIEFKQTLNKAVSIYPDLGKEGKKKLVKGYFETADKPIKERPYVRKLLGDYEQGVKDTSRDFAFDRIAKMRHELKNQILGGRPRQEIRDYIEKSLEISKTRAKFIARQETALLTVEFKKIQYLDADIKKYKWITVGDHIVRGRDPKDSGNHVVLNGNIYSWDNPPDAKYFSTGTQCHPGEDYNCRCQAKPIVEW